MTRVEDGPGYWVKLVGDTAPVTLFNVGVYPPRPLVGPVTYTSGPNWNLMGYTTRNPDTADSITFYFGLNDDNINPPGPTAIYQYNTIAPNVGVFALPAQI